MNTKIYVGNLSFDTTETDVREVFSQHGQVNEVLLPTDRDTGRIRGFAFLTMNTSEGMQTAIREMDGKEFLGRRLTVNEARPREDRPAHSGGGGRSGANSRTRY